MKIVKYITFGIVIAAALSVTGCQGLAGSGLVAGMNAASNFVDKKIYHLKGGDAVADATYETNLRTMSKIVKNSLMSSKARSDFDLNYSSNRDGDKILHKLYTPTGSVLRVELTEVTVNKINAVRLYAKIETAETEADPIGYIGSQGATSTGGEADVFLRAVHALDADISKRNIKKLKGQFRAVL